MTKFIFVIKVTKNNLRIMPKSYAHIQTMTYSPVKFQINQIKIVGGVAYTRYLLLVLEDADERTGVRTEGLILCPLAFLRKGGDNTTMSPRFS